MSKEQIEEMAKVLEFVCDLQDKDSCIADCDICRAVAIYNAGYRKQIVGEWKQAYNNYPRYVCTNCNHLFNNKAFKYCPNCGARMKAVRNETSQMACRRRR